MEKRNLRNMACSTPAHTQATPSERRTLPRLQRERERERVYEEYFHTRREVERGRERERERIRNTSIPVGPGHRP